MNLITKFRERAFRRRWGPAWWLRGTWGYYFVADPGGYRYAAGAGYWVMVWKDGVCSVQHGDDCGECGLACAGRCEAVFHPERMRRCFTVDDMRDLGAEGMEFFPDYEAYNRHAAEKYGRSGTPL